MVDGAVWQCGLLTTAGVLGVLIWTVLAVFDSIADQRLKQALGSVLADKLHVTGAERVCGWRSKYQHTLLYHLTHFSVRLRPGRWMPMPLFLFLYWRWTKASTYHSSAHRRHLDTLWCRCSGQLRVGRCHWSRGSLCTEFLLKTQMITGLFSQFTVYTLPCIIHSISVVNITQYCSVQYTVPLHVKKQSGVWTLTL